VKPPITLPNSVRTKPHLLFQTKEGFHLKVGAKGFVTNRDGAEGDCQMDLFPRGDPPETSEDAIAEAGGST
jgi:hypothetical protein